jgi:hypothetical protein
MEELFKQTQIPKSRTDQLPNLFKTPVEFIQIPDAMF